MIVTICFSKLIQYPVVDKENPIKMVYEETFSNLFYAVSNEKMGVEEMRFYSMNDRIFGDDSHKKKSLNFLNYGLDTSPKHG